jgi:hypothetical protein
VHGAAFAAQQPVIAAINSPNTFSMDDTARDGVGMPSISAKLRSPGCIRRGATRGDGFLAERKMAGPFTSSAETTS